MLISELKKSIREVPDFPRPGVNFYDVSTLFRNREAFVAAVNRLIERFRGDRIDALAGIEARGFVLAGAMAYALETGVILVRKSGKLPHRTEAEPYALEYGEGKVEIHRDAVEPGQRIVIVDDVLATGGTAAAVARIVQRLGGRLEGFAFMVELGSLGGRRLLPPASVFSLLQYD
jgi:adenine phosphoribosyltransferase